MATHGSLKIGDWVGHPTWSDGVTRKVVGFCKVKVLKRRRNGGPYLKNSTTARVVILDAAVSDGDTLETDWMEAGLEKVDG